MRFHIGFSKRISIKTILWLLGALFVGLCTFLGISETAYASPMTLTPSSASYSNNLYPDPFTPTISLVNNVGYQNLGAYYFAITNPGASSFNFTYYYNAQNFCTDTNYRASGSFQYSLEGNNSGSNVSMVYSNGTTIPISLNNSVITFNNIDFSRAFRIVFNSADGNNSTGLYIDRGWNITCNTDPNQTIIDNAEQNTQDIIDNQNNNTQNIIDNQNQNTQVMIDSQKVCNTYQTSNTGGISNYFINSSGNSISSPYFSISPYYQIYSNSIIKTVLTFGSQTAAYACFYNSDKQVISSCVALSSLNVDDVLTIPTGAYYFRTSVRNDTNRPLFSISNCLNGNQAINDSLTDDNISNGTLNNADSIIDYNFNDYGLTAIITAPVRLLQSLVTSNDSCQALTFDITMSGSTSKSVSIPSGCILWDNVPSAVNTLFLVFVYGFLAYYVLIDMYKFTSGLIDPDDKNMYVMDL